MGREGRKMMRCIKKCCTLRAVLLWTAPNAVRIFSGPSSFVLDKLELRHLQQHLETGLTNVDLKKICLIQILLSLDYLRT